MNRAAKVSIVDIAIFCMVMKNFMESSATIPSVGIVDDLCVLLYIVCVVALIIKKKYKAKALILIGAVSVALLYTSVITGYSDPIITFLFIVAIKDKDIDSIIEKIYRCYCIMLVAHIICTISFAWMGNIRMVMHIRGIDRYTLGFIHPNATGSKFFAIMMLNLWVKKYKKSKLVFWAIASTIVYFFCKSRTAYILSLITIILVYMVRTKNVWIMKSINKIASVAFPGMAAVIYALIRMYEHRNPIAVAINAVLSGRINLAAYALDRVGFTILGRSIDFYGPLSSYSAKYALNDFTFDCIYSFIFCNMGLVYLVVLSILFFKLAVKKMVWVNASIIIWSLYAVTEVSGLNGFGLFPIFYLVLLINEKPLKMELG